MSNNTFDEIYTKICQSQKITLISHIRPDGDTLGCAYAMRHFLESLGKEVTNVCSDRVSEKLKFYCDAPMYLPYELTENHKTDLVITLDVASYSMLGDCLPLIKNNFTIKIDHHGLGDDFANLSYVDGNSASCSEIVYDFIKERRDFSFRESELLYAGICFDTGCFKHSNVTSSTHEKAAYLISKGIDFHKYNVLLFEEKTQNEVTALKLAYNSIRYFSDGKIALVCIDNKLKAEYGLDDDDIADISQIPIEIKGVVLGITIKEKGEEPGAYKLSMRSRAGIDCSLICKELGGGGHVCASGGLIKANSSEEAITNVISVSISMVNSMLSSTLQ